MSLKLNSLISIVYALFFFTDPLILGRVVFLNDGIAMVFFAILMFLVAFQKNKSLSFTISKEIFFIILSLLMFFVISAVIRLYAGQNSGNVVQYLMNFICVLFFVFVLSKNIGVNLLINAYLIACIIHFITVFPIFESLNNRLAMNTAYPVDEYSIGIFTRRATGFFTSPGYLSIFSSGGFALGLTLFTKFSSKKGLVITVLSFGLGLASFSRSFFVVCLFMLLFYIVKSNYKSKMKMLMIVILVSLPLVNNVSFMSYVDLIGSRFDSIGNIEENDRFSGETGLFSALQVIESNFFTGSPISPNGGGIMAWNGDINVRPHIGFIALLCFYGMITCFPLFYLIIKALYQTSKDFLFYKSSKNINVFTMAFFGVNLVCLVEPLMDSKVYMFFLIGVLIVNIKSKNNSLERNL